VPSTNGSCVRRPASGSKVGLPRARKPMSSRRGITNRLARLQDPSAAVLARRHYKACEASAQVPSRCVLKFDWARPRLDEDIGSGRPGRRGRHCRQTACRRARPLSDRHLLRPEGLDHPEQWAAARMNLGIPYWQRVAAHWSENRERAIAAFEDARSVLPAKRIGMGGWPLRSSLGLAFRECAADSGSDNRDRAIEAFGRRSEVSWTGRQ
jgi:hypothetical protein